MKQKAKKKQAPGEHSISETIEEPTLLLISDSVQTLQHCQETLEFLGYGESLYICPTSAWKGMLLHRTFDLLIFDIAHTSDLGLAEDFLNSDLTLLTPTIILTESLKVGQRFLDSIRDISLLEKPVTKERLSEKVNFALFLNDLRKICGESI